LPQPLRRVPLLGRLGFRLATALTAGILLLGILSNSVNVATAAPDVFYLHDAAASQSVTLEEVQTGSSASSTSVATTANLTGVKNQLYLAAVSTKPDEAVTSVSGLGLTWTLVDAQCGARAQTRTEVWRALGTPSGNGAVTANFGSVHRHHHVVRVFGTKATFIYDDQGPRIHRTRDEGRRAAPVRLAELPPHKGALIPGFVDGILAGRDSTPAARREFDLIAVIAAADESRRRKRPVAIGYPK